MAKLVKKTNEAIFNRSKKKRKTDEALSVPYLVDAKNAGGEFSDECTLILAEGNFFAEVLSLFDIGYVNQGFSQKNYYGVYPLGGKMLNVSKARKEKILKNAEIQHIVKILGLEAGKVYDNAKSLRYGHVMIMTNQHYYGFHVKGLLINLFHCLWPSLLKIPSFLSEFIIPIAKATHSDGRVLFFYNMPQYESWNESLGGEKNWTIQYYKRRRTREEYFQSLEAHQKDFTWVDERDGDAIDMAFSKKKIEARKAWLWQYKPGNYIDRKGKLIKYSDFVNKELILFFWADLQRSIPSMVDGLKLDQREILFIAFKRNLVTKISVELFPGYVSEHFGYHPSEAGVHVRTIIGMVQNFVGTNNINLFYEGGLFGSRHEGVNYKFQAKLASYISTNLTPIARLLFPKDDDILLDNANENGQRIEPSWYAPIIPLLLVNGSEGCGTGGSYTFVPNYNPRDVCENVKRLLRGEPMVPIHPWYKGFQGTIEKTTVKESGTSYTISGIIDQIDKTTLRITELPIRTWTRDYQEFLETAKKELFIKEYYEASYFTNVGFKIIMSKKKLQMAKEEGLMKEFKLTTTISTNKMFLFDKNGVIKKYDNPEQIIQEFFDLRFDLYKKRCERLLKDFALEISKLQNTKRLISCVLNSDITFGSFIKDPGTVLRSIGFKAYEYLPISLEDFTKEKVTELDSQIQDMVLQQQELRDSTTPETLWMKDLDALDKELDALEKKHALEMERDALDRELALEKKRDALERELALEKELDDLDAIALIHEKNLNGKVVNEAAPDSSFLD